MKAVDKIPAQNSCGVLTLYPKSAKEMIITGIHISPKFAMTLACPNSGFFSRPIRTAFTSGQALALVADVARVDVVQLRKGDEELHLKASSESRLTVWSHETGSAVLSRVSPLIFCTQAESSI